jgi:hypothetical protein
VAGKFFPVEIMPRTGTRAGANQPYDHGWERAHRRAVGKAAESGPAGNCG